MYKFIINQAYNLARKAHKAKKNMTDKELTPYINKQKAIEFKALQYDGNSQDVLLVGGTPIIAHKTVRNIKKDTKKEDDDDEIVYITENQSVFNNEEFEITSIDSKNQVQAALESLQRHDVVKQDNGQYIYTVELMRRWVAQQTGKKQ